MPIIDENTVIISAEPAQTIVWTMPGRGSAIEPGGYLQRVDVIGGALNGIIDTYGVERILVIGSMPAFVEKVFEEVKEADTTGVIIDYQVML